MSRWIKGLPQKDGIYWLSYELVRPGRTSGQPSLHVIMTRTDGADKHHFTVSCPLELIYNESFCKNVYHMPIVPPKEGKWKWSVDPDKKKTGYVWGRCKKNSYDVYGNEDGCALIMTDGCDVHGMYGDIVFINSMDGGTWASCNHWFNNKEEWEFRQAIPPKLPGSKR